MLEFFKRPLFAEDRHGSQPRGLAERTFARILRDNAGAAANDPKMLSIRRELLFKIVHRLRQSNGKTFFDPSGDNYRFQKTL
jgi:hypothetical protein